MPYGTGEITGKDRKTTGRTHPGNGTGYFPSGKENSLQKQLIEKLEEENRTLQEQAWKYLETMRQMLKDIHP